MTILVEFRVPADEFVLSEPLTSVPSVRIEIKRVVAGIDDITPYFWVFGSDIDRFEEELRKDMNLRDVLTLEDHQEDERFYRVTWVQEVPDIIMAVSESKATILEAVTEKGDEWELKVLFAREEELTAFREYCESNNIDFRLTRLYYPESPEEQGEYDITPAQLEALELAYEKGYFNVPRDISLSDLAAELGISRNACSARIRRGIRNVLDSIINHSD